MLIHPQNPVCAAFLCQALEAYSWGNIAAEVKKEDKEREIPKKDFPEENPQVGQLFFAKIDADRPEVVYGIDPLPPDDRTFDEVFFELFGKKVYDIVSARWEKQAS